MGITEAGNMIEKIKELYEWVDHLKGRIEELEAFCLDQASKMRELEDIVSKMGVKVDFTSQESGQALGEIAELRDFAVSGINNALESRVDIFKQLNELKERWAKQQENIDYNMKFITDHTNKIRDAAIKDDKQIKEVLREFIKIEKEYQLGLMEEDEYETRMNGLLAKLDVRSAAHTECKWETSECCMKPETVKEEELIDSGGEKTVDSNHRKTIEDERLGLDSIETDSKPPEPIMVDGEITRPETMKQAPFPEPMTIHEEYEKGLKEGKWIEYPPREDKLDNAMFGMFDKRTHVLVKREKIEFWREELLNKTDEVLKSMRKVLGIE